eukprot:CAMPEP_0202449098 /NCGR_PEP_ID=MMETSP1360-20130828/7858_1 /ASSEMBLY_ACC=CAM_ASM_000848 /TAXON_ID=515479 /ORGANISM="Licmophora paradoxa, Strain CCMP2313" /LENGTH=94 /DNA_ID=CAMNT_0049066917 /DNA_START=112 /DNA_END=393 /DNA_ORIENTATION=+
MTVTLIVFVFVFFVAMTSVAARNGRRLGIIMANVFSHEPSPDHVHENGEGQGEDRDEDGVEDTGNVSVIVDENRGWCFSLEVFAMRTFKTFLTV